VTVDGAAGTGGAAIEVGDIFGKVNVLVSNPISALTIPVAAWTPYVKQRVAG
jgi:hypothetical protein